MKHLILLLLSVLALAIGVKGDTKLGKTKANPATSCNEIYQRNPTSRGTIGKYYIKIDHDVKEVTCNMKLKCGGLEGGWMQVANLEMTRDETCPGEWELITAPRRLCQANEVGCHSANFSAVNVTYEHICGQVKAYQKGSTDAFNVRRSSVDSQYVDGISITLGSPRKHVWTFASGISDHVSYSSANCPCATVPGPNAPAFVGNNFYCESGNSGALNFDPYYLSDPLWDGKGCDVRSGCCAEIGKPWFYRKLPIPTTGDFEVRICKDEAHSNEDIGIEQLELYVRC